MTNIEKIQGLVKQLNNFRHEYYNLNSSSVSDLTYDKLFDELQSLEIENNYILSNSPTQSVGYEVKSKLQKVEHPIPLKSLDKETDVATLRKFIGNKNCLLMLKNDGLTAELLYENGSLKQASTRGNSFLGEDITHNAKVFKNIPKTINYLKTLRLAGEAIIHWNDFDKINENLTEDERRKLPLGKYKTPRNLAAGSVRQLDSKVCAGRNVYFYAFNLLESDMDFKTKNEQLRWLESLGFIVTPYAILTPNTLVLDESIDDMRILAKEINLPIDGLVCAYNDIKYAESLGETAHHPLHSIAFKFEQEKALSILESIEWQIGRTGILTPVANFETVNLDGTEVSKASVHNLSIIESLGLGILDRIYVIKANQIIPQIVEDLDKRNNIQIPKICPACGSNTYVEQLYESKVLYCSNENCSGRLLQAFSNFVKRDAMNIEGLSEATLSKLIDKGFIKTFADIYKLEQYKSQIEKLDGFGKKSYQKLIDSIEESKTVKMENFLVALGIDQIGKGGAKRMAHYFGNDIDLLFDAVSSNYDLSRIEDFGQVTADAVMKHFKNSDNRNQVYELLEYVTIKGEEKKVDAGLKDLSGVTFVITGGVNTFKNRDEFKVLVESLNGKVAGSVSSKTNYLVNNDTTSTSGKNQKAKEVGVSIISEEDFNMMINRWFN